VLKLENSILNDYEKMTAYDVVGVFGEAVGANIAGGATASMMANLIQKSANKIEFETAAAIASKNGLASGAARARVLASLRERLVKLLHVIELGTRPGKKAVFSKMEAEAGAAVEQSLGIALKRSENEAVDWIDKASNLTYDHMRTAKAEKFVMQEFVDNLQTHLIKADRVVLDLRFIPKAMGEQIERYVQTLSAAARNRIIYFR
jgi:hypothetical protein